MKKIIPLIVAAILLISQTCAAAPVSEVYSEGENYEQTSGDFPESFDLRNVEGKNYVTPVRSQSPFGTCWSFATVAALETSILGAGLNGADGQPADAATLDLSEKQLAWFSAMPLNDPGNPQDGEGQFIADFITEEDLVEFMNRGGNESFSANAIAQGIGPANESDNPYLEYHGKGNIVDHEWKNNKLEKYSYSITDDWSIPDEYRFIRSYDVRTINYLPSPKSLDDEGSYVYNEAGTKAIKEELMSLRAVQISFCADTSMPGQDSDAQYISENWAHYTYLPVPSNHEVTIIGWDDHYSRDNFIQGTIEAALADGSTITVEQSPPADGAWLVKNSWGSGTEPFPDCGPGNWGIVDDNGVNTGYFWLSYYDQSLGVPASYIVANADKDISIIDQMDYMQVASLSSYYSDDEIKMCNFFTARQSEFIEQVASFTENQNTTVTYEIYLVNDYCNAPEEGLKIAEMTAKYRYGGYHKEDISDFEILVDTEGLGENRLLIPMMSTYAVCITQTTEDGQYAIGFPSATYDDGGGIASFKGIINDSESWIYMDGEWCDYKYADDVRKEMARTIYPDMYEDEYEMLTYDNFPIKVYCRPAEGNHCIEVSGSSFLYYGTERNGSSTLRVGIHAANGTVPEIPAEDVSWHLDEAGENCVELDDTAEDAKAVIMAKNTDDAHGTLYVTIKGIGSEPVYVQVGKIAVVGIILQTDPETESEKTVYTYTGDPICPAEGLDNQMQQLIEGEDFEYVYENNVKCGLASIRIKCLSDIVVDYNEVQTDFLIVPPTAEIESAEAAEDSVTVSLKDQSESGLTGYLIEYRKKGTSEWSSVTIAAPETEAVLKDLQPDTEYEVKARGFIECEGSDWFGEESNYGEESDTAVVKTGIVQIKKEN